MSLEYHKEEYGHWTSDEDDDDYDDDEELGNNLGLLIINCEFMILYHYFCYFMFTRICNVFYFHQKSKKLRKKERKVMITITTKIKN